VVCHFCGVVERDCVEDLGIFCKAVSRGLAHAVEILMSQFMWKIMD
jgi:hypothetical protein